MKFTQSREWLPLAWTAVPVALPLLLVSTVVHLNGLRGSVDELEREIQIKRKALTALEVPSEERATFDARRTEVTEWGEMAASDSLRVAELSRIAASAGVTLRSLRSVGAEALADDGVVASSHDVSAVGSYRGLAAFLDGVYSARGMARVEGLEIEPDGAAGMEHLRAALRVTWSAKSAATQEPPAAGALPEVAR